MTEPELAWYGKEFAFGLSIAQVWIFLSPILAGLIAAWFTHRLREKSERQRKKEEWLATKLAEAYQMVTDALEHPGMDPDEAFRRKLLLEKAINTVDLYGDAQTKGVAQQIAADYAAQKDWIVYEPLLTKLRDRFRESIGLERLADPVRTLKFARTSAEHKAEENK